MQNPSIRTIPPTPAAKMIGLTEKWLREVRFKGFCEVGESDGHRTLLSPFEIACVAMASHLSVVGITRRKACAFVFEREAAITGLFVLAMSDMGRDYVLTLTVDRKSRKCVLVDCERSDQVKFSSDVPLTIRMNVSMILRSIIARIEEYESHLRRTSQYQYRGFRR